MIFFDEQTSVSLELCKKIDILHSYMFDHDIVSERKNKFELQINFDL